MDLKHQGSNKSWIIVSFTRTPGDVNNRSYSIKNVLYWATNILSADQYSIEELPRLCRPGFCISLSVYSQTNYLWETKLMSISTVWYYFIVLSFLNMYTYKCMLY